MSDLSQVQDPALDPTLSDARERSLNEDLRQLGQEARAYAQAELSFQKSRAAFTTSAGKTIAVYAVAALMLVFFAVMALVVGLVIALGPWLTPWGSMALVTLVLLGLAVVLLLRAKRGASALMQVFSEKTAP